MAAFESGPKARSTAIHSINADNGLGVVGKTAWLLFNAINNTFPFYSVDRNLIQADFTVEDLDAGWDEFRQGVSPARRLCDLFWKHLQWRTLARDLGGGIRALEVGCGSGSYGELLNRFAGGRLRYRGVDISAHPAWGKYDCSMGYEFFQADSAGDIHPYLKDINFVFTQSALEHFSEDLTFFQQIADFVRNANYAVFQAHLFPSADCITTFPWHGIREYTPRTISKITRLFQANTRKTLYRLGSSRCNKVHRRWITLPSYTARGDQRGRDVSAYDRELKEAIRKDMDDPGKETCFYALVIQSRPF